MRYRDRVDAQKGRNPCLTGLSEYLTRPGLLQKSRIAVLDFFEGMNLPVYGDLLIEDLDARLQCAGREQESQDTTQRRLGQLLIIEDISPKLIENLGNKLDINPWFFASYIHSPWRSQRFTTPQNCCLPSRHRSQTFISLAYHKSLSFTGTKPDRAGFLRDTNQHRKVIILPETTGHQVGLVQHNCATLLKESNLPWTGIILVDSPINDNYRFPSKSGSILKTLPSTPFLGGPEAINNSQRWSPTKLGQGTIHRWGMLDEIVYQWAIEIPTVFDPLQPTAQALSYLPLKIIAAEWINYIAVMSFSLKHYEVSDVSKHLQAELDRLSVNLRTLQTWRRRVLASIEKIHHAICYLKLHEPANSCLENWIELREDYEFIRTGIQEYGNRLESMIPVATSFIQLVESRRALLETGNITRLTVLALIFIPLSYTATLFSISGEFGPGSPKFWVYFVIALPITFFVLLAARVPKPEWFVLRWPTISRFSGRQ